jgi:invasion protein IalB
MPVETLSIRGFSPFFVALAANSGLTLAVGHARGQTTTFEDYKAMSMNDLTKVALIAFGICVGGFAQAQDSTATDAPAEPATEETAAPEVGGGLSLGQEVEEDGTVAPPEDGVGSVYSAATHGDWDLRCVRAPDGSDPCQLYQLLKDQNGNAVAEISLFGLPGGKDPVAGATIIAPLETLLTENLRIQVDAAKAKAYPFTFCTREGCVSRVGLTAADVAAFKRGNKAVVTIIPAIAPDQKVTLEVSLKGFTAGYDAVIAANNAAAASGN